MITPQVEHYPNHSLAKHNYILLTLTLTLSHIITFHDYLYGESPMCMHSHNAFTLNYLTIHPYVMITFSTALSVCQNMSNPTIDERRRQLVEWYVTLIQSIMRRVDFVLKVF